MIVLSDPAALGAALTDMRLMRRLSRRAVAGLVGMHESQYGQYELGHKLPSVAVLLRLWAALGYDVALIPREEA